MILGRSLQVPRVSMYRALDFVGSKHHLWCGKKRPEILANMDPFGKEYVITYQFPRYSPEIEWRWTAVLGAFFQDHHQPSLGRRLHRPGDMLLQPPTEGSSRRLTEQRP